MNQDPEFDNQVIVPVLAVVGRPNVGKSTLVNRIIGRREAVVEDVPGVTRDRVYYDANWNGRAFTVVDTGGWDPDARGLAERIAAQAQIAARLADAVLFVVDATVGITDTDEAVVSMTSAPRLKRMACGTWDLGSPFQFLRCTDAVQATCWTRFWLLCQSRHLRTIGRWVDRAASRLWVSPM
jgi:small GTP-binding protein